MCEIYETARNHDPYILLKIKIKYLYRGVNPYQERHSVGSVFFYSYQAGATPNPAFVIS